MNAFVDPALKCLNSKCRSASRNPKLATRNPYIVASLYTMLPSKMVINTLVSAISLTEISNISFTVHGIDATIDENLISRLLVVFLIRIMHKNY